MRLYIVRHAEAVPGEPDELRRLSAAGRDEARALGKRLAGEGVRLDAILTSPMLRARETGAAIGRALHLEPDADERLAPGATVDDVRAAVAGRGQSVLIVGHQPDCGEITSALTGGSAPDFRPAGLHVIDVEE